MKELQHTISAEEIFGTESRLVEHDAASSIFDLSSLGVGYQVAVAVVAIVIIFAMVRYAEVFRHILLSALSRQAKRSDIHIFSAEIHNLEIVVGIIGVITFSLLAMRFTVLGATRSAFAPLLGYSAWGVWALCAGAMSATILGEYALLKAVAAVSGASALCRDIWQLKMLHFSCATIVVAPILLIVLLNEGWAVSAALYCSFAVCSITLFFFLKETFFLFRSQKVSIFHWILYLCALEILPLSLLVAPIARGGW